jgi:glycosyltransferase involved in cell wall biosynthesis
MSNFSVQFSIIICTYKRPTAVLNILNSIELQTLLPFEVLLVDASEDNKTGEAINNKFLSLNIRYFLVEEEHRGLTKQRNFGIRKLSSTTEIVIFLDDDLILENEFCQNILCSFINIDIVGAEGYITNELKWKKIMQSEVVNSSYFYLDNYKCKLSRRDRLRKYFGLYPSNLKPGGIPKYGHGKSSLPPTNKVYFVEHLMGGITAYRRIIFDRIQFSEFFEGYGLYEDFDFSVRASAFGKLVANTSAKCEHHHDPLGRPNYFKYGKMVVWNGYYVWRLKHQRPGLVNIIKWYLITILLMILRFLSLNKDGLNEGFGRLYSLIKLQFKKPI